MAKVTVTETYLEDIADAIREKNGSETTYKPSEMAGAIDNLPVYPEPTGTKEITANGTGIDVKDYASADVYVPNSYGQADEGKVVSNGALVAQGSQTITENDTYDTTLINSLTVQVSGGGSSSYPFVDDVFDGTASGYTLKASHAIMDINPASNTIQQALTSYFTGRLSSYTSGEKITIGTQIDVTLTETLAESTTAQVESLDLFRCKGAEYSGYVYGTSVITNLGLVLLGDFSQGGSASGNVLADSIANYSGIILQGIYQKQMNSVYNTSCLYQNIDNSTQYWAGMKDRNNSYRCGVTFTDSSTVSLDGNKQVIIYGIL